MHHMHKKVFTPNRFLMYKKMLENECFCEEIYEKQGLNKRVNTIVGEETRTIPPVH